MASIFYKWLLLASAFFYKSPSELHPVYVSVVEIEHNKAEQSLEMSCRIFTDDFEKTLRGTTKQKVDLINPTDKKVMEQLVNQYIQQHLKIRVNGKAVSLNFLGYEQVEESIQSYYQVNGISAVNNIMLEDNILYEYKAEQMSIIHITVNGNRKSTRLTNPDSKATIEF